MKVGDLVKLPDGTIALVTGLGQHQWIYYADVLSVKGETWWIACDKLEMVNRPPPLYYEKPDKK